MKAFAETNGAVLDWEGELPRRMVTPYSVDLSCALVRSNEQPVLLVVEIERNDGIYARFSVTFLKERFSTSKLS